VGDDLLLFSFSFSFHFIAGWVELESSGALFRSQDVRLLVKVPLCKMRTTDLSLEDSSHGWRMLNMQWVLPFDLSLFKRCIE
jgi:hypothetical protein